MGKLIERSGEIANGGSERVLPWARELLAEAGITQAQLDGIAFGAGPGGFTGLRLACGVAQGLAWGLDLPVLPVSSLEALALACGERDVWTCLDARMNEVYVAAYRVDRRPLSGSSWRRSACRPPWCPRRLSPAAGEWATASPPTVRCCLPASQTSPGFAPMHIPPPPPCCALPHRRLPGARERRRHRRNAHLRARQGGLDHCRTPGAWRSEIVIRYQDMTVADLDAVTAAEAGIYAFPLDAGQFRRFAGGRTRRMAGARGRAHDRLCGRWCRSSTKSTCSTSAYFRNCSAAVTARHCSTTLSHGPGRMGRRACCSRSAGQPGRPGFYLRHGFEEIGRRRDYYPAREGTRGCRS
jgi:tRNA threonylcarbamoyl adenosine modification protein YeaZ